MKNRLFTLSFREIKTSFKRFLSLVLISLFGVAVFVGIISTSKTLMASLDAYYDKHNMYDIKIVSTLGLTDEDIDIISGIESIKEVYGEHSKDEIFNINNSTYVIKLIGVDYRINSPIIELGRLPEKENEIAIEKGVVDLLNLSIGDTIEIEQDNELKVSKFTVVGICYNPTYLLESADISTRGPSTLGSGTVNFYTYVVDDVFNMNYYTEIYVTTNGTIELLTNSEEYNEIVKNTQEKLDSIKDERVSSRYKEVYAQVSKEIKANELLGKRELNKAKTTLDNAKTELVSNEEMLNNAKEELANNYIKLVNAEEEIASGEKKLSEAIDKVNSAKEEINNKLALYNLTYDDVATIRNLLVGKEVTKENFKGLIDEESVFADSFYAIIDYLYDNNYYYAINNFFNNGNKELIKYIPKNVPYYDEIVEFLNNINIQEVRKDILTSILTDRPIVELKKYIPQNICHYDEIMDFLDNAIATVNDIKELFDAIEKIEDALDEIKNGTVELEEAKLDYENGYNEFVKYQDLVNNGEKELKDGYKTYNNGLREYYSKKNEFESTIKQAKVELKELEVPTWYINSRKDNSDYSTYINASNSIERLSIAYTIVFLVVAVFMIIMSMSRMALENRSEIGALKSLGFSSKQIMIKYIIYAAFATAIGSVIGSIGGFLYLTFLIFRMYRMLYSIFEFKYFFSILPFIIGILGSIITITFVSILTVKSIVTENAVQLLRPKAPKAGKKLFVERFKIWKYVSFSNKVTIRNIFRYRKRVIMTIIGIACCTILLITGYGIRDSISNIVDKQYTEVQRVDDIIYLDGKEYDDNELFSSDKIAHKLHIIFEEGYVGVHETVLNSYDPKDNTDNVLNLVSVKDGNIVKLEKGKVAISSKIARLNKLSIGDNITFKDSNNKEYTFEISDIFVNYVSHHIVMDRETYRETINNYEFFNDVYLKFNNKESEEEVISEILKDPHVLTVMNIESLKATVNGVIKSLDSVVIVLILLAGLLSFVVLYNLSYINISERTREIASLKVLGFNYFEVDNYIIKENFFITIVGIILGLIFCKPFVDFIVSTVEVDLVAFVHELSLSSYICTGLFMLGFTIIVSIIIHFTLTKINMIESLKSVE